MLRMTREEIGSQLRLKLETAKRAFSNFQHDDVPEVKQRQIIVLDPARLQQLMGSANFRSLFVGLLHAAARQPQRHPTRRGCRGPENEESERVDRRGGEVQRLCAERVQ